MDKFFYQELPCSLSEQERNERAQQIAMLVKEYKLLAVAKRDAVAAMNAEMKALVGKIDMESEVVNSGRESRAVRCEQHYLLSTQTVRVVRCDTGEEVSCRKMTDSEVSAMAQPRLYYMNEAGEALIDAEGKSE